MGRKLNMFLLAVFLLAGFLLLAPQAWAQEEPPQLARDISNANLVTDHAGFIYIRRLFDKDTLNAEYFRDGAEVTLEHPGGIGSLYLLFNREYGTFQLIDNETGASYTAGTNGFLHEFMDVEAIFGHAPASVTLRFNSGLAMITELYVFSPGQVPDFVQKWEPPKEGQTDLVLFSTHGDDEQLFFAGLLPYYAAEMGYQVQVVYFTNHWNQIPIRAHEMLNGLWAVGVKTYPVFGKFPDLWAPSVDKGYEFYENAGYTRQQMEEFVVEQLRRFRPQVAVGHDVINGEYGHGAHIMYAQQLCSAVVLANDPSAYPESAEKYGLWDVPKTYLHLYPENPIYMDWDQPLESFDGMTAFQVTQKLGFPCHETQQTSYDWYITYAASAAAIPEYSPCEYGLFRSTVGPDVNKNDMFENVLTHVQLQQEQERREREAEEEAARRAAEEAAQREAEQRRAEEARAAEEAARLAREEADRMAAARREKGRVIILSAVSAAVILPAAWLLIRKKRASKK